MCLDCPLSKKGIGSVKYSFYLTIKNQGMGKNLSILSITSPYKIPNASKSPQKFLALNISASETTKNYK